MATRPVQVRPGGPRAVLRSRYRLLVDDPLVRNSVMLMLMGGLTSLMGFGFWLLNARLYSPADIGLASTLLSGVSLLSYLSLFGMNNLIIRNATSRDLPALLSSSVAVVTVVSLLGGLAYLVGVVQTSPGLAALVDSWPRRLVFLATCIVMSLNVLTDSAFIAKRAAHYNLLINALLQGSLKLGFTLVLTGLAAFGLVTAAGAAVGLCALVSLLLIDRRLHLPLRFLVSGRVLREGAWFSGTTYVSSALQLVPPLVVPLIVLSRLGEAAAGFYFIAFQIASLVLVAADAVGESLFAEHSHGGNPAQLRRRSGAVLAAFTCSLALAVWLCSPIALAAFGSRYQAEALPALHALLWGAPAVGLSIWSSFLLKSQARVLHLLVAKVTYVAVVVVLTTMWAARGLIWVAAAFALGHLAAAVVSALPLRLDRGVSSGTASDPAAASSLREAAS